MLIKKSGDGIEQYLTDESNFKGVCDRVFIVENTNEVAEVISKANNSKTPVTVCGNHTSLTGSSIPKSGWVIATERLNKIIEINAADKYVIVEPGVTLQELQSSLKEHNLFFPPDPTETSCFVGGMVGTNASGARSYKYGATRNFIGALEIVLADGTILNLERGEKLKGNLFELAISDNKKISFQIPPQYILPEIKNTVGYYLKPGADKLDLFIGAEGTLGVITSIKLNVCEIPAFVISFVVFIDDVAKSFSVLNEIKKSSQSSGHLSTRLIEFFDERSLNLLTAKFPDIPAGSKAAFWIEQECENEDQYYELIAEWESFFTGLGVPTNNIWFGIDQRDRDKILNFRHMLPLMVNDLIRSRGLKKLGTDIAVPDDVFEKYYNQAINLVQAASIDYVVFGHFGDSHMHLNMLPRDNEQAEICRNIYSELCIKAIGSGGTFSAEHGVGKIKKDYLRRMLGDANVDFMKSIKSLFDPYGLMGCDTLF